MLSPSELSRYRRHIQLEQMGIEGQQRLASARVLVAGLGGLGGPAALYLAGAGVGVLGLADFDQVEEHNLQRQILYDTAAVGRSKVAAAAARLRAANPFIQVIEHPAGVTPANAFALFSSYDVIVDGTDTFPARYLNNDAAVLAGKPLVHGSIFKFEGQVTLFDPARGAPCYRCLYPDPPPPGALPDCGEAGVLGALCGVIGSLQALETVKLIAGLGEPARGRMLVCDSLRANFHAFTVARNPECSVCGDHPSIRKVVPENYALDGAAAPEAVPDYPLEISVEEAKRLLDADPEGACLIDVREPFELEICRIPGGKPIPLGEIPKRAGGLPRDRRLLIYCHHGHRSLAAAKFLREQGLASAVSMAGGLDAWARRIDPEMRRY